MGTHTSHGQRHKVILGEPWPEGIDIVREERIEVEKRDAKSTIMIAVTAVILSLVVAFVFYGIVTGDDRMLRTVWGSLQLSLGILLGWAVGHKISR